MGFKSGFKELILTIGVKLRENGRFAVYNKSKSARSKKNNVGK